MSLKRQMQETTFSLRCAHKVVKLGRKKYYGFDMPFRLCLSTSSPLFPSLLFSLYFPSPFIPFLSYFVLFCFPSSLLALILPIPFHSSAFILLISSPTTLLHPSLLLPMYSPHPLTPPPFPRSCLVITCRNMPKDRGLSIALR